MALLKPSLTLVFDLDERQASRDTQLELKRCYAFIGQPVIRTHVPESDDAPISNTANVYVNLGTRKYLHSSDEGADELWDTVVEHWIGNMLYKIGNNMKAFNRRQRKIELPEILMDHFDIVLQGGEYTVSLHPNLLGYLDDELTAAVTMCRTLLNDGTFADAVRVRIPADISYEKQSDAYYPAWLEEHPEPEEEPEEDTEEEEIPERDFNDPAWLEYDAEQKSYENTAVPPTDSDELPSWPREEEIEPPEPYSFDVNYDIWEVIYADGSSKYYDSINFAFIDEVPDVVVESPETDADAEAETDADAEAETEGADEPTDAAPAEDAE